MVVEALRQTLERSDDLQVVGSASTIAEGARLAREHRPDVVVIDFHLPDGDGAEGTRQILSDRPDAAVIMLTGSPDAPTAAAALEAGCIGFVAKDAAVDELVRAIRGGAAGEVVVPPELLAELVTRVRPARAALGDDLTDRELEVLQLLVSGRSTTEIVDELVLSTHTVRNHIRNILNKLQAHSRLEAVAIAIRIGIVTFNGGN